MLLNLRHFIKCQQIPAIEAFCELRDYAESLDEDFVVSANTYNMNAQNLYALERATADFVGAEMQLQAVNINSMPKILLRLRIAEALGKRVVTPGIHWEWEQSRAKGLQNNVKIAIAAIYASGHILSPPDFYDWVSPHYYGNMADYGPYYRFIREHPELFDEFETLSQVGVLYSSDPLVSGNANHATTFNGDKTFVTDFNQIATLLYNGNFPAGVALAGDGIFVTTEFTEAELRRRFEVLVEPRNLNLSGDQAAVVEKLRSENKVFTWTGGNHADVNALKRIAQPWLNVTGGNTAYIWAMPRTRNSLDWKNDPDLMIHMVNRRYNSNSDEVTPGANVPLEIRNELLAGRKIKRVACYLVPDGTAGELAYAHSASGVRIQVPELDVWNVIHVLFE